METKPRWVCRCEFLLAIVVVALGYTVASADCAIGGSCTFANGDWFNFVADIFQK
ncbi:MAG: hypothetical protein HYV45_01875 [Candidatus Moranbacteria bacterium]|nr:hypothetical protein [Candidatus Moranbacteria bacterium]